MQFVELLNNQCNNLNNGLILKRMRRIIYPGIERARETLFYFLSLFMSQQLTSCHKEVVMIVAAVLIFWGYFQSEAAIILREGMVSIAFLMFNFKCFLSPIA